MPMASERGDMDSHPFAARGAPELFERQRSSLVADRRFRELLDAIPDLVMLLNDNRQILFANRALLRFCASHGSHDPIGLLPGEALSCQTALATEKGCGTGEACNICGPLGTTPAGWHGKHVSCECRILRHTSHGTEPLDLRITCSTLHWHPGKVVILVASDIGQSKRREVLEQIFFHDILNTAGTVNQIAEMLLHGMLDFDGAKHDLWQASQMLVAEIRGQSDLMAAESAELQVKFGLVLVRELLDSVATLYRNHELGLGRRIVIKEQTPGLLFLSDGALLTRILGNLLKNGLEASHPGEAVTLGCRREETDIVLWCHNEGVLTREVQGQIFQRSFSTKGYERGVGTYSMKLLSERYLQGRVELNSSRDAGTVFTLTFPVAPKVGSVPRPE